MPYEAVLGLAAGTAVVRGCRSKIVGHRASQLRCGRRMRKLAVFQGPGAGWFGIRSLRLGIRAIVSAGCTFGRPEADVF
jgi:hypothetical protein